MEKIISTTITTTIFLITLSFSAHAIDNSNLHNRIKLSQSKIPIVKPGKLIAVNTLKDTCYNIDANGKKVKVKCPDVIVAKPNSSSRNTLPTVRMVTKKARAKKFVPRRLIKRLGINVSLAGSYVCYKEDYPGHFITVKCPDIIILDTNN